MSDLVMAWLWRLTGGRPMIDGGSAFYDSIGKLPVRYFTDRLGHQWLAVHAWSLFRVRGGAR